MKHILTRTLETTIKKSTIILSIIVGIIAGAIISSIAKGSSEAFESFLNGLLIYQHLFVFFLINGIILICICISNASGLIANEIHEGTFRLLIAKPNSRTEILFAKIIGTIVGCIILMTLSLLSYYSAIYLLSDIDPNIMNELMAYLPSYLLYGLFVIIFFTSLSTLLSCVFKKKITALLPMLFITIVMLGVFPIFRLVSIISGNSLTQAISFIDINYHFAIVFKACVDLTGEIKGTTETYMILSYLMGIFKVATVDQDFTRTGFGESIIITNDLVKPIVSLISYLFISIVAIASSFVVIKRKDI